jgi:hypothetical protein
MVYDHSARLRSYELLADTYLQTSRNSEQARSQ